MSSTHHGILVHIVFSTKLRFPLLHDDWRDELFAYIGGTVRKHKATILKSGGIADHIHLLAKIHPAYAISETVNLIKANSSRWINQQRKIDTRFEWQRGYGVFSVSQSMVASVKDYLANQAEHHKTQSFREEYLTLLTKHRIEFDDQYVFDEQIVT